MLKSKGCFVVGLLLIMSLVAAGCAPRPEVASTPTFVLKNNVYLPANTASAMAATWYADEVFKRTGGRVKIETYYGGALGGIMENLKLTSQGVIDMSGVMGGNHPAEMPLSAEITFPFIIKDAWVMGSVMTELYRTYTPFREEYEKKNGIKMLVAGAEGIGVGNATVPIRSADDFRGKKMRAFGQMSPVAAKLGATPVTVPTAEVYEAIKRGTVVGDMGQPYSAMVSYRLYEVSDYVFDYGVGLYYNYMLTMNLDVWNKLPKDVQKIMDGVAEDYLDALAKYVAETDAKATETMKARGNQFYRFPPQEIEKARAAATSVREEYIAKAEKPGVPAREFFEKYQALVKKYESKSPLVHPFPK